MNTHDTTPPAPRRLGGRVLLLAALLLAALLLIGMVLATAVTAQLLSGAMGNLRELVHISVDGRPFTLPALGEEEALAIAAGLVILVMALLVAVPIVLLLVLAGLTLGMLASALAAFAPLLLLGGVVWLVWRLAQGRKKRQDTAPSTTIAA
jgi:hypothetical protein